MSFDALSLKILTLESSGEIIGRTVDKISENREKEFAFILRNEYSNSILYISINPNFPVYFHSNDMGMNLFNFNSNFSMILKKYLCGARITGIETLYADRILVLKFLKKDAFSEKFYGVVFEFMGKHSNAFIYSGDGKPGALSHNDVIGFCHPSENLCEYISAPQKTDIRTIARQNPKIDVNVETSSALIKTYTGLSPKLCGFIKTSEDLTAVSELFSVDSKAGLDALISKKDEYPIFKYYNIGIYTQIKSHGASSLPRVAAAPPKPYVYPFYAPDGSAESRPPVFYGSLNEAYYKFYNGYNIGITAFYVEQKLLRLLDIAMKKLSVFRGEAEISRDFEKHSEYGKLLISYISSGANEKTSVGRDSIDVYGVPVPVDKKLSASVNAQKHFKMNKKLRAKFRRARKAVAGYENIVNEINGCIKLLNENSHENIPEIERSVRKIVPELISERS
ncbi:MAG TPA: NFACT family protein, partial [Candidatus Wallbacteria bacterium]|nr:NFACT family protein [Candidatus Wallbacteria bacterium]